MLPQVRSEVSRSSPPHPTLSSGHAESWLSWVLRAASTCLAQVAGQGPLTPRTHPPQSQRQTESCWPVPCYVVRARATGVLCVCPVSLLGSVRNRSGGPAFLWAGGFWAPALCASTFGARSLCGDLRPSSSLGGGDRPEQLRRLLVSPEPSSPALGSRVLFTRARVLSSVLCRFLWRKNNQGGCCARGGGGARKQNRPECGRGCPLVPTS